MPLFTAELIFISMEQVITGIYAITNPNGETYIGQSIDIKKRWGQYRAPSHDPSQTKIHHSLKTFGWEKHHKTVIHECTRAELDEMEYQHKLAFIQEKGWEKALFCHLKDTAGGKNYATPIIQYSLDASPIQEFESKIEASRQTGTNAASIWKCCNGTQIVANGFLWGHKGDPPPQPRKEHKQQINHKKAVIGEDRQGNISFRYDSVAEASKEHINVQRWLSGKATDRRGYKWYFEGEKQIFIKEWGPCPHCGAHYPENPANMKRWHYDNCKNK